MMSPDSREPVQAPILASNAERDAVTQRLQVAFAEHRLNDDEFDQRIRTALTARSVSDLDRLTADLPASAPAPPDRGVGPEAREVRDRDEELDQPGRPLDRAAAVLLGCLQGQRTD